MPKKITVKLNWVCDDEVYIVLCFDNIQISLTPFQARKLEGKINSALWDFKV